MAMRLQREFFVPKGSIAVRPKLGDVVAYIYDDKQGRPGARIFAGKQSKPFVHCYYRTQAEREAAVRKHFEWAAKLATRKAEALAAKKDWANPYKVGDLFMRHWGYDQTNINWYEVTEVKGKMMTVREIGQAREYTQSMAGKTVPLPGQYIGEALRVRAQDGRIKINHYDHAYYQAPTVVAGVPTYGSSYFSQYA